MALIGITYLAHRRSSRTFRTIVLKTSQKRPFLDTKSDVEPARRLKRQRNLFVVMRFCSPVVSSYLDAGFEPPCRRKDFWTACCCCCCLLLLLLSRLELELSWVLVLCNALEITVDERPLALDMCLHGQDD